jgi:CheY-like chemotaxis protein
MACGVVVRLMVGDPTTILVAEDNADCRYLYSIWLGEEYAVRLAPDGTTALERLDSAVDILFLDRDMPGPTGTEVAREVAASPYDPYVVMVSSMDPDFDIAEMPIDQYVQKPFERGKLRSVIEQCRTQEEYRSALDDFFSLTAKLAAIEAKTPESVLAESDEYERLRERVAAKREEVDSALAPEQVNWSLAFKTCPDPVERPAGNPNV